MADTPHRMPDPDRCDRGLWRGGVVEQLSTLVDQLDITPARDELLHALRIRDRLDARIAVAVGTYDNDGLYELDGDLTMATWLGHHAGLAPTAAKRDTIRGRKLRALPVLTDAFLTGRISGGQVDLIVQHLPVRHLALFAEHEAELLPSFEALTVRETATAMATWLARADALDPGPEPSEHDSEAHLSTTIDGRGELHASLDPDDNAVVRAAFDLADSKDLTVPPAQRRGDALVDICRHYLDHQQTKTGGRHRPHLNVAMTYEQWLELSGGTYLDTGGPVSATEAAVLACDAVVHRILLDGRAAILDYGRSVRTPPVDLYNAVVARDQGCRWPSCERPASHCDAHHVTFWERDGHTKIDNLVLLCRRHHRRLHHQQWKARLEPDGTVHITAPDGRGETTRPPGPIPQQLWRTDDGGNAHRPAA